MDLAICHANKFDSKLEGYKLIFSRENEKSAKR
jgi:hypothetical protein